ncbi:hypothetical protein JKP88DRAFT_272254 [Tribonema minus]|uniref:RBR-type E3 ubiquitin transferase n=1 Tax=Tribonema minus TaxID=303371 RepID=A0A835ZIT7_9STRA|nr:hypothetical protein JKP88DRAFT_272254 [Tribonema minus]
MPSLQALLGSTSLCGSWLLSLNAGDVEQLLAEDETQTPLLGRALLVALQQLRHKQETSDLAAAVALQLQEVRIFASEVDDSSPERADAHAQHSQAEALDAFRSDLCRLEQTVGDDRAARSLDGTAVIQDHMRACEVQREMDRTASQERADYELTCRLSGQRPTGAAPEPQAPDGVPPLVATLAEAVADATAAAAAAAAPAVEDDGGVEESKGGEPDPMPRPYRPTFLDFLDRLGLRSFGVGMGKSILQESSQAAAKGAGVRLTQRMACSMCLEDKKKCAKFACDHAACRECLHRLFSTALEDTSLIPIRCCAVPVDPNLATVALTGAALARFRQLEVEASVTHKMYCPRPTCSMFINLDAVMAAGQGSRQLPCPSCGAAVCTHCRAEGHTGSCEAAAAVREGDNEELTALVAREGWQRCGACGVLVELVAGCYHMTCRCRHEFCYVCVAQWKTCTCPIWDERRLLRQAQNDVLERQRVLLQQGHARPALRDTAAERQRMERLVDRRRAQLLAHDECAHAWARRQPTLARACQNCGYDLWVYCFECTGGCGYLVCQTCRFHRLGRQQRQWF